MRGAAAVVTVLVLAALAPAARRWARADRAVDQALYRKMEKLGIVLERRPRG